MIHIISDLNLGFYEEAVDQLQVPNETTIILVSGNIAVDHKRSMLFSHTLAEKHPSKQVLVNLGISEILNRRPMVIKEAFQLKCTMGTEKLPNFHYPSGKIIGNYDFYSHIGLPILSGDELELFYDKWRIFNDYTGHIYIDDILVSNKSYNKFTLEAYNEMVHKENMLLENWLNHDTGKQKVLLLGISSLSEDLKGICLQSQDVLLENNDLIIVSCGKEFTQIKKGNSYIVSSPGRDRTKLFDFDKI